MIKPVTIEDMVKMMNFRSVISFLLKAMMNTLIIEKTVINIIIAEKTLAAITSIVKLLSQKSFSYILPPNEWNRHHFLYFYWKDIDNKLRYIELLPICRNSNKFFIQPFMHKWHLVYVSSIFTNRTAVVLTLKNRNDRTYWKRQRWIDKKWIQTMFFCLSSQSQSCKHPFH